MNEEALNLSIRKFLKSAGISSQREIEHAVTKAAAAGAITGTESLFWSAKLFGGMMALLKLARSAA
jgi:hypothetical protein